VCLIMLEVAMLRSLALVPILLLTLFAGSEAFA
jgi:hypothetical protein